MAAVIDPEREGGQPRLLELVRSAGLGHTLGTEFTGLSSSVALWFSNHGLSKWWTSRARETQC